MWAASHVFHERREKEARVNGRADAREVLQRKRVGYTVHTPLATIWRREAKKFVFVIIFRNNL